MGCDAPRRVAFPAWDYRQLSRLIKFTPALFFAASVTHAVYVDAKLQLIKKPKDLVQMLTDDTRRAVMMAL